ncbi:MAG TPA: aminopeptidase N [Jatrophihabitans sp.]|jgi:aminopeptidase N
MPSLTRIEATDRADLLDIEQYRIDLDLTESTRDGEFGSDTTISFRCSDPSSSTFLDVHAASIASISLNGSDLDPATIVDGRLPLSGLQAVNELRIVARMSYSSDGEGMHRHLDPADGKTYLYAMSFLDAAPRWFACFDQPDLKARYDVTVSCPPDWTVVGNGAATQTEAGRWRLANTQPLSTYFVTVVAGPYHSITRIHDGITLGVHARSSLARYLDAEADDILTVTAQAFDRYHELFGIRYPFGEYHQAFVPDFNAGAMENPGCVTLRDQYVFRSAATTGERGSRARTVVHELAHMWFGDLVTMRWWDDLWLNESFAEYMAHRVCAEVTRYRNAWTEFGIRRKDWGSIADQAPSTHPVAGNGSVDAAAALQDFDGISYAKGASVLKQLAAYLGDEVFLTGLRAHFDKHRFDNAEFADLIGAWTAAGAVDLDSWAEQWLRTSGMDTLTGYYEDGQAVVSRRAPDTSRRPHALEVIGFDDAGSEVFRHPGHLVDDELRFAAEPSALVVADGTDDSWAKVRPGPDGWNVVRAVLPTLSVQSSRVVLYNAVRDAVRDADLDPAQALDILLGALQGEPDDLVTGDLLRFATVNLIGEFSKVSDRAARWVQVTEGARTLMDRAAPGSDAQLEAARGWIRASADSSAILAWLAGRDVPGGLRVDAELRWALLRRAAVLGATSPAEIEAELARDNSTSGATHASFARAALPDADAKERAWRLLVDADEVSAYELYATAEGFFMPSQTELTARYVPRFFEELPATASHRQGWALSRVVLLGYPTSHASAQTLRLAEAALADDELAAGVRRSLVDGTNVLRRAVQSLQRYAG